uniref:fibronectin-binding protein RevA n=1 Tax=Borreliella tanukii TaxID=56146 RepID=UPI003B224B16
MNSCEIYSIVIGTKFHSRARTITIDKRKVNFMLKRISELNIRDDKTAYKNFKESIKTLKIDLQYAINTAEIEENFLILENLFQEKLTAKLNALKADRADIESLLTMVDSDTNLRYIQEKARLVGVNIYLDQGDTTQANTQQRAIKEIYKNRLQGRHDYIIQTIQYLEEH